MKKTLHLTCFLLCLSIINSPLHAQIRAHLIDCNTIIVTNEVALQSSKKSTNFSFILEKHLGNDIWMSLQKKNKDKTGTAFLNLKQGIYRVKLSTFDGNRINTKSSLKTSETIEIKSCHQRGFSQGKLVVDIFPNPASDIVTVKMLSAAQGKSTLSLFNSQGRKLKEVTANENNIFTVIVSDLSKGIYFIDITDSKGSVVHKKIIIH